MKTLPNGLTVFNGTPHSIRFWDESWDEPVEVESDMVINAIIKDKIVAKDVTDNLVVIDFVTPEFLPESNNLIDALQEYRDDGIYVIGSIIAAQAYPGLVFGMTPCAGYERVPPEQKRMNPNKFVMFQYSYTILINLDCYIIIV